MRALQLVLVHHLLEALVDGFELGQVCLGFNQLLLQLQVLPLLLLRLLLVLDTLPLRSLEGFFQVLYLHALFVDDFVALGELVEGFGVQLPRALTIHQHLQLLLYVLERVFLIRVLLFGRHSKVGLLLDRELWRQLLQGRLFLLEVVGYKHLQLVVFLLESLKLTLQLFNIGQILVLEVFVVQGLQSQIVDVVQEEPYFGGVGEL